MIDVEGYEPQVLRGCENLLRKLKPMVIFEYNYVSKQHFDVRDIQNLLGTDYVIYWLTKDAMLDLNIDRAWNCLAIPHEKKF